jgi:hypothetical protein
MKTAFSSPADISKINVMENHRPRIVWLLIGLQVFLSLGALFGGGAFILSPDGSLIHMPISHLEKSPFSDFLIPGLFLFTFLGIYPLVVAYCLWKKPTWRWPNLINPFKQIHWSWAASLVAGVIVLIWITVETLWVPFGLVHIFYLVFGAVILGITLLPDVHTHYTITPN